MKIVQKLEIAAGVATLLSTVPYFSIDILPHAKFVYDNGGPFNAAVGLLVDSAIILVPSLLTAIGAYVWAVKGSEFGFATVVSAASITAFVDLVLASMLFYSHGFMMKLLILAQVTFPILTLVYAFLCLRVFRR